MPVFIQTLPSSLTSNFILIIIPKLCHFQVQSPCFKPGTSITWSNAKHDYEITGSEGGYQACLGMASSAVNKNNIDKPKEIINGEIFAFSYFFDRASEAGLIDAENGGKTKGMSFTGNSSEKDREKLE